MTTRPQNDSRRAAPRRALRSAAAVLGLAGCLLGMWSAGRAGASRYLSRSVVNEGSAAAADEAVRLAPADPDAHSARASVLLNAGEIAGAVSEYEAATALRPGDHLLWTSLGTARGYAGDSAGALAAHDEAVRLAPHYSRPYWYRGAYLLELGRQDEAFADLRRAAASNPALLPDVLSLAWDTYGGDAAAVRRALLPQTGEARMALANFFARQGSAGAAVALFREAGADASAREKSALLAELLNARHFAEAHEVWSAGMEARGGGHAAGAGHLTDGGFEGPISRGEQGFGWRPARNAPALHISLDAEGPRSGGRSLCMEFGGDSGVGELLSQLVLVEPSARYRLAFAARTEEVVTGGRLIVSVTDTTGAEPRPLAQSPALPQGTTAWQEYALELATAADTRVVLVSVRRQTCPAAAKCPVFGRVWFDNFTLEKGARAAG